MRRLLSAFLTAVFLCLSVAIAAAQSRTHIVQPGENLYRIALRYAVTVDALARINGLSDPAQIRAGLVLIIPDQPSTSPTQSSTSPTLLATYTVQAGDTLFSLARRFGTSVPALMAANRLSSDALSVGQVLVIPVTGRVTAPQATQAATPAASPPPSSRRPGSILGVITPAPRTLRVRRGPKSYFVTLALVAEGTPLRIVDHTNGWHGVQLPAGDVGWVRESDLPVAVPPAPVDESQQPSGGAPPVIMVPPVVLAPPATLQPAPRLPAFPLGRTQGREIVAEAMRYLGVPYVWGGSTPNGVDCSGLVYVVLSSFRADMARLRSFDLYRLGMVVDRADLQPGDLVFFTTYAPGPSHVGIALGDGRFIQASSGARRVTISSLDDPYYAARYLGARRLTLP